LKPIPLLQSEIVQVFAILFGALLTVAARYALGSRLLGSDFTDPRRAIRYRRRHFQPSAVRPVHRRTRLSDLHPHDLRNGLRRRLAVEPQSCLVAANQGPLALLSGAGSGVRSLLTIPDAFDGRPITLWRCGQTMRPGQLVKPLFPQPLEADAVVLETAPGQSRGRFKLEGQDPSGAWPVLNAAPAVSGSPLSPTLRSEAASELRRCGIGYLLSFENEPDTLDLHRHPELSDVREVAHNQDAKLT
jgi:hypothetical protein